MAPNDGPLSLADLAQLLMERAEGSLRQSKRFVLGLVGAPAAGKSTLSIDLRDAVNERAGDRISEIAPMDGFHLTNAQLAASNSLARKGEPDTFDAVAYRTRLKRLRSDDRLDVPWPAYDRRLHDPVPAGFVFTPDIRIVITEGNYLLLDTGAWSSMSECFDDSWFLDTDLDLVESRLIDRHRLGGKTDEQARHKTRTSDMPNSRLVIASRHNARVVISASGGSYWVTSATGSQIIDPSSRS